jgi:hypothetical protein
MIHPIQKLPGQTLKQSFSRRSRKAGPLKCQDFLSLASDLETHVLQLSPDVVESHDSLFNSQWAKT